VVEVEGLDRGTKLMSSGSVAVSEIMLTSKADVELMSIALETILCVSY